MKPTRRKFWIAFGVLGAFGLLFLLEERLRGEYGLRAWQRRFPPPNTAEDPPAMPMPSQRLVLTPDEAVALFSLNPDPRELGPTRMRPIPPNLAEVGWRRESWRNGYRRSIDWERFGSKFAVARRRLAQLRPLLIDDPPFVIWEDAAGGSASGAQASAKALCHTLSANAMLALHERNLGEALQSILASLALADLLEEDRQGVSVMTAMALRQIVQPVTWEALQAEGWTDEQLEALQAGWNRSRTFDRTARSMEYQQTQPRLRRLFPGTDNFNPKELRAAFGQAVRNRGTGGLDVDVPNFLWWLKPILQKGEALRSELRLALWWFVWAPQDQLRFDRKWQQGITALRCAADAQSLHEPVPGNPDVRAPEMASMLFRRPVELGAFDRLRFVASPVLLPRRGASFDLAVRTEVGRELTTTAIALKRYRLRHGGWPPSLSGLVPEFLPRLPLDWYAAAPLRYQLRGDDRFLLYSVGENGQDDGGIAKHSMTTSGLVYLTEELDIIWLWPASPEEIAAATNRARSNERNRRR